MCKVAYRKWKDNFVFNRLLSLLRISPEHICMFLHSVFTLLFTQFISNPSDDQNSAQITREDTNVCMQRTCTLYRHADNVTHQCFFPELKVKPVFSCWALPSFSAGNCSDVDLLLALVSTLGWRIDELE